MRRATVAAGIMLGACLLARPDFVLFVGPALLGLFAWRRREGVRAAGIAAAVVAPWLIFTTAYYGSPVPNTIRAKSLRYHVDYPGLLNPGEWWDFVSQQVGARETWWHTFTPFLENGFVTEAPILPFFSAAIAVTFIGVGLIGAAVSWRTPGWRPAVGFMALFVAYRFVALPEGYYEWYYPPFTALLAICAGVGFTHLAQLGPAPPAPWRWVWSRSSPGPTRRMSSSTAGFSMTSRTRSDGPWPGGFTTTCRRVRPSHRNRPAMSATTGREALRLSRPDLN